MSEDSLEGNTIENKPEMDNDNSWDNAGNGTIGGSTIENQPSTPNDGGSWDSGEESWGGAAKAQSNEI